MLNDLLSSHIYFFFINDMISQMRWWWVQSGDCIIFILPSWYKDCEAKSAHLQIHHLKNWTESWKLSVCTRFPAETEITNYMSELTLKCYKGLSPQPSGHHSKVNWTSIFQVELIKQQGKLLLWNWWGYVLEV